MARTSSRKSARRQSTQRGAAPERNSRWHTTLIRSLYRRRLRMESLEDRRRDVLIADRFHPPSNDCCHAKTKLLSRASVGLLFGFCCSVSICSAEDLRVVALSGTPAPGTESGVVFRSFDSPPALNNRGQTAFSALLSGTGVASSNERGVWSEGGGHELELIARKGSAVPGAENGVVYGSSIGGVLSENGQTILLAELDRTSIDNTFGFGYFRKADGSGLELIVDNTSHLPGIESGVFPSGSGAFAINNVGQTAFWLIATDDFGSGSEGIWSEGGGNGLELIARSDSTATSNEGQICFDDVDNDVIMNDHGLVTFVGAFRYVGAGGTGHLGIWSGLGSSLLRLVARTDTNAPGTESGVNFSVLAFPVSNNNRQIAFWGRLSGTGIVQSSNDTGYWSEGRGNGLELIARTGSAAPGTDSGVNFKDLGTMVLNENGEMAFSGRLTGPSVGNLNDEGIWSEGHGDGLKLIAHEGDPAPGTENGVKFGSFFAFDNSDTSGLALNGRGQTAFAGKLTGVGVDFRNDYGIWAEDVFGRFHLIAREGDMIDVDVGPGIDLRRILRLDFIYHTRDQDGGTGGFNDFGQLAFQAAFYDGTSGMFVSNLVAVPEPATVNMLILGIIAMCFRCRLLVSHPML